MKKFCLEILKNLVYFPHVLLHEELFIKLNQEGYKMSIMPDREDVKNAIKWVSMNLEENANQPVSKLVEKAVFKFDLSPADSEFLLNFFRKKPV
jgi:hypothetical protein